MGGEVGEGHYCQAERDADSERHCLGQQESRLSRLVCR